MVSHFSIQVASLDEKQQIYESNVSKINVTWCMFFIPNKYP